MVKTTLTALYGPKDQLLTDYLKSVNNYIFTSGFQKYFEPYLSEQVHATLIGLEAISNQGLLLNKNLWKNSGIKKKMHFEQFFNILDIYFPMKIRIGGFNESDDSFLSNGQKPYNRSFNINEDTGKIVLMGWPVKPETQDVCNDLWEFRKTMESACNIAHKYRNDNDFYMVLGTLNRDGKQSGDEQELSDTIRITENLVRTYLRENPLDMIIEPDMISIVKYLKEDLELETSEKIPSEKLKVDKDIIRQLFS